MKKIISAALAATLAASMSVPAFAILTEDGEPVIQGDIMLLSESGETPVVMDEADGETPVIGEADEETPIVILPGPAEKQAKYSKTEADILRIMSDGEEESILYKHEDAEDTIQANITGIKIFDTEGNTKEFSDIEAGAKAIIFIDNTSETGDPAYIVIKGEEETGVSVDYFTVSETLGEYVDTQNFLAINLSEDTEIVDVDGNELTADDIADKYLMVFYDKMTMSIPAIANPSKIVVLGEEEAIDEPTEEPTDEPKYEYEFVVDGEDAITDENSVIIIPVRKYAEGLGLEVGWNGDDMSVTVGTIPMGVSFKIGENSYSKARMTPFTLETAPQLINDITYVPVSFFEQVLEAGVKIAKAVEEGLQ